MIPQPPTDEYFDPFKFHQVWTPDTDEDYAFEEFVKDFKRPPQFVMPHNNQLWVGPIPHPTDKEE